jgi:hypothetical protein
MDDKALRRELTNLENGGTFALLGINNFLEGDFFGWYLDAWDTQPQPCEGSEPSQGLATVEAQVDAAAAELWGISETGSCRRSGGRWRSWGKGGSPYRRYGFR